MSEFRGNAFIDFSGDEVKIPPTNWAPVHFFDGRGEGQ